jgi:hypothetical protein
MCRPQFDVGGVSVDDVFPGGGSVGELDEDDVCTGDSFGGWSVGGGGSEAGTGGNSIVVVVPSGLVTVVILGLCLIAADVVIRVDGDSSDTDSAELDDTGLAAVVVNRGADVVRLPLDTTSSRGCGFSAGAACSLWPVAIVATAANRVATTTPATASTTCGARRGRGRLPSGESFSSSFTRSPRGQPPTEVRGSSTGHGCPGSAGRADQQAR